MNNEATAGMNYPATVGVETPDKIDNWRPLVQWLMAIPHLIIASALEYVAGALAVVSWFAILITGKLPVGLANFQIMIMRYTFRAHAYAGFLHDTYPPFEFSNTPADPGGHPVEINVEPDLGDRNRLTVALRFIWIIPAALYMFVIAIVGIICWFLAFFAVLFTGRWPEGLRTWVMNLVRVGVRVSAYGYLLTDEYPPFSTD